MTDSVWLIYRRRSRSDLDGAGVSDQSQLDECVRLIADVAPGAKYEVIDDLGGTRSGRGTKNRTGWAEVIRRVESGGIAGVVAKDVSRLARNARLVRELSDVCTAKGTRLRLADMPNVDPTTPEGKLLMAMMANVAEMYSDLLSRTMQQTAKTTYEAGGVWAKTPFGYRTAYAANGDVEHVERKARMLVIEESEAAVVRRVFDLLPTHPYRAVAEAMQREGAIHASTPKHQQHDGISSGWSTNTVKDLYRRRELYAGRVTANRGLAPALDGKHDPIITEEQYRDAVVGVEARKHHRDAKPRTATTRLYALRGLAYCGECGSRLRGETRKSRGKEWLYLTCPVQDGRSWRPDGSMTRCDSHRVPAIAAEAAVADVLVTAHLPEEVLATVSEELRLRLVSPAPSVAEAERKRLTTRLRKLADLYGWGDMEEVDYRRAKTEAEAALAALPTDSDRLVLFDEHRARVASLGDEMASMTREQLQEIFALMIERVETKDQKVTRVVLLPEWRPFFDAERTEVRWGPWRPRTDSNRRRAP